MTADHPLENLNLSRHPRDFSFIARLYKTHRKRSIMNLAAARRSRFFLKSRQMIARRWWLERRHPIPFQPRGYGSARFLPVVIVS